MEFSSASGFWPWEKEEEEKKEEMAETMKKKEERKWGIGKRMRRWNNIKKRM